MKASASTISSLMTPSPVVIDEDATLDDALAMLEQYRFRHLPVTRHNEVVGILSDRDLRLSTAMLPAKQRVRDEHGNKLPGAETVSQVMRAPVHCLGPDAAPAEAARDMVLRQIGAIPVADAGCLVGIVTETNLLHAFVEVCRLNQGACDDQARHHMHRPLPCVEPGSTVEDALERLDPRVGHLGVEEDGKLLGIVSERDLLVGISREMIQDTKAEAAGRMEDTALRVRQVMSHDVLTVEPEASLSRAAKLMTGYRYSALPVVEDGQPTGILTQRDILEYFATLG